MTIEKPPRRCRYLRKFCQNVVGVLGFMGKGIWDQIFGKSDESLVRLAKAFAGKGMRLVLGYE
jgi:hypothetical protein